MGTPAICPLCEATCGILVEVAHDRIVAVRGDPEDPFSRGYVCPKASALVDLHDDPDRLRTPLVREGRRWRDASWDEALSRAALGLRRIRRQHGRDAVGVYYGNPVAHNLGLMLHGLLFVRALRTRHAYSASSSDQLPQMLVAWRMLGHFAAIPVPDLERVEHLLIVGANPLISNGSLMTAPGMRARLRAIRARGGRIVVVDPCRTETAEAADQHIAVRPGTDVLLLAAMLHVVFAERLVRLGRIDGRARNLRELEQVVRAHPPERVEARTGVAAAAIRQLARDFARARTAAAYGRVGLCTQPHGTIAVWLLQALNAVTGRMDEAGGMMFPTPAADVVGVLSRLGQRGALGRWRSAARGLPEFGGELPVATLAEDAQGPDTAAPDRARIRALVTMAGNPVLSAPDGPGIDRTLASLEHVVAIDPYLNETTRHAHVILPPAPPLSRGHYPLPLYAFSVRNVAKYAGPVVPRREHERHDWEIVSELAVRLLAPRLLRRPLAWLGTRLTPERIVDALLRAGPHGLNLAALRRAPHGLDLGPLQPGQLPRLLRRGAGIDLAPPDFVQAARLALADGPVSPASDQLLLIGRRQALSHNSWMHNLARVMGARHRCALLVHPLDAAARGLARGDLARVESETGGVTVPVELTDTIRPGVVSLPHGWGHHRDGLRLGVAGRYPGVSLNDLTSALRVDGLSGTAAFNGLPVTLRRLTRADLSIDSSAAPLRSTPA